MYRKCCAFIILTKTIFLRFELYTLFIFFIKKKVKQFLFKKVKIYKRDKSVNGHKNKNNVVNFYEFYFKFLIKLRFYLC